MIPILTFTFLVVLLINLLVQLELIKVPLISNLGEVIWGERIIETLVQPFLIFAIMLGIMSLREGK